MFDFAQWTASELRVGPLLLLTALTATVLLALLVVMVTMLRQSAARARDEEMRSAQSRLVEAEIAEVKGRLAAMAELEVTRQAELSRSVNDRLDRVSQFLGTNLEETQRRTTENLARLYERLAVIDSAQKNLTDLSNRVVSLQDILANKQARGAFGQMRMETIIQDGLPRDAYGFQAVLSNGKRPDCLIHLPGSQAGIVIDAKFPLESFEALRVARDDAARKEAMKRVRTDIGKHIDDIAAKYFIPGETQDTAMMFVPAESVYAELHEGFPDLIQKAHRSRIVIVSPNMLMLAVQTMVAVMKDVRMREQAGVIQREVGLLMEDVGRLRERVLDFQKHYGQLGPDLEKILTSTDKIASRGRRIEGVELDEPRAAVTATGQEALAPAAE